MWSRSLETGVKPVDDEHQVLIAELRRLHDSLCERVKAHILKTDAGLRGCAHKPGA